MPIRYAEITIIRNLNEETILCYLNRLLGNENKTTEQDTIILLFDDETICDCKNKNINKKIKIAPKDPYTNFPIYLITEDNGILFFKTPIENNGNRKLDFKKIFTNKKYLELTKVPSVYNCIYYKNNNDVFAIIKIKSNEEKPRFLLAYDDEYFEKDDIIYLVNYIF